MQLFYTVWSLFVFFSLFQYGASCRRLLLNTVLRRIDMMTVVLVSWSGLNGIDKVVSVDWGSEPALTSSLSSVNFPDTRIVISLSDAHPD